MVLDTNADRYALAETELYWRDHYNWLLEQGYRLRPRYQPAWTPSWKLEDKLSPGSAEDALEIWRPRLNDAIRLSDDQHVVLKRISKSKNQHETSILNYFAQESLSTNPKNHCIPVFEVLHPPGDEDCEIAVLPILRAFDDPQFDTIGEAVDSIRQLLEGFAFLHKHRVAHRDVRIENIMMDSSALGFERFHFCRPEKTYDFQRNVHAKFPRTERGPRYFIIDFGFSTQYSEDELPPSELPRAATDNTAPEFSRMDEPSDPFPIDVFCVGHLLQMEFIDGHPDSTFRKGRHGFEFLTPLIDLMTKHDPTERITMQEAVVKFDEIICDLSIWKLRSRVIEKIGGNVFEKPIEERVLLAVTHFIRKLRYTLRRIPPIPNYEAPSTG